MKRLFCVILVILLPFVFNLTGYAAEEKQTIKILAIGNSFTQNSVSLVRGFCEADTTAKSDLFIASLTIGGSSFKTHADNIKANAAKYGYNKRYKTNEKTENVAISDALTFEDWDYIVLQQVSHLGGMPDSYEPHLEYVINYIKSVLPDVKIVLNQTWAYETYSKHQHYDNYNNSQEIMHNALVNTYSTYAKKYSLDVIPCGEAFANARLIDDFNYNVSGNSLCVADGYHANVKGCYLIGAVWFEYFTKQSVWDTLHKKSGLSDYEMYALKEVAYNTVKSHYTLSGSESDPFNTLSSSPTSSATKPSSTPVFTPTSSTTQSVLEKPQDPASSQVDSTTTQVSVLQSAETSPESVAPIVKKQNSLAVILIALAVSVVAVAGISCGVIIILSKKKQK